MLHVVSKWCLFHSVQIQSVEIRDLERSLWIFFSMDSFESLSRFINLCQHGEAQEKAWAGKVRTSINSVFVTLWWKCQNVWNRNLKLRAAISVCFYHDQNYELTILQIYAQESKKERKEKFHQGLWSCRVVCWWNRLLVLQQRTRTVQLEGRRDAWGYRNPNKSVWRNCRSSWWCPKSMERDYCLMRISKHCFRMRYR